MSGSSKHIVQFAGRGGGGSDCEQTEPLPAAIGVIPTLVVAKTGVLCNSDDRTREYKGVVFYDGEPMAWWCLADDEIAAFRTWAAMAFPSVQIVAVDDPATDILCSPTPNVAGQATAAREDARKILRRCAQHWFVPATPTGVTRLVA
jgi:hypothetical protein